MKSTNVYLKLVLGVLTLLSCSGNLTAMAGELTKQQQLEESLQHWQLLKNQHYDKYQYSVSFSSWVGFSDRTTMTVHDGVVVKRAYEYFDQSGKKSTSWQENSVNEIGDHKRGAVPKTVDQLYYQCSADILSQSTQDNYISLAFDEQNILRQCTFRPKNCADDCAFGVSIESLKFTMRPLHD
jgi:hypothetical protein